jgi:hypothetical protein
VTQEEIDILLTEGPLPSMLRPEHPNAKSVSVEFLSKAAPADAPRLEDPRHDVVVQEPIACLSGDFAVLSKDQYERYLEIEKALRWCQKVFDEQSRLTQLEHRVSFATNEVLKPVSDTTRMVWWPPGNPEE